ncbi:hypothetical protein F5B22DRAFT_346256 [Xylaria bambusicola]|uniref:uncharacterized protein n=1 Tax=Xylaria bambusicola TaxID=326684 RepID=UPI0020072E80|nr:uncharacterized protein F5B22DRAFT_346256 [Xylaria bambusicola]KAI0525538.1 hypothetical protein F5B22DRAFT_346256 [Xylaria bambusicola]
MYSSASDFKGPPPYSSEPHQSPATKTPFGGLYNDPRTSSTQSLAPSLPAYEEIERRKLLVIYIHGFMGNDTSFQSFPAHVHKYLKLALSDSHVVHSKIYPRYKTYKSIEIARDNFSTWLEPLESPKTDIILVGHSMGGLLAADVVLKPSTQHNRYNSFKHRILGVVNLDAPLLGMHPGIIVSGISSLFRKNESPKLPGEPSTQAILSPGVTGLPSPSLSAYSVPSTLSETLPSPPPPPAPFMRPALTNDSNYNPNFANDVRIEERTWWKNVVHFVKKHNSEGLIDAAANHVMSHMEFGGTMFDINTLKTRYESIRRLEDVDELNQTGSSLPRVRFIQYYTICNGFPKKPKEAGSEQVDTQSTLTNNNSENDIPSRRISANDPKLNPQDSSFKQDQEPLSLSDSERSSLELLSPEPIVDEPPPLPARDGPVDVHNVIDDQKRDRHADATPKTSQDVDLNLTEKPQVEDVTQGVGVLDLDLPEIASLPPKPDTPNLENYTDKDARKLAGKEAKRAYKAYAQAVKDREKAVKEREKIIEKRKKKLAQEAEKKAKEEQKKRKKEEAAAAAAIIPEKGETSEPREWTPVSPDLTPQTTTMKDEEQAKVKRKGKEKAEKQRKFCNVPKSNGQVDPKWVGIFMKDMDQVAAHTSLFFAGEHYESLVGDVGNIIVEWVHADMTKRTILELD